MGLLELCRRQIAKCRVPPLPITGHLDVLEDTQFRFFSGFIMPIVHGSNPERTEEALQCSVTPAVTFVTHVHRNPHGSQERSVITAGILREPRFGVVQRLLPGFLAPQRDEQGIW